MPHCHHVHLLVQSLKWEAHQGKHVADGVVLRGKVVATVITGVVVTCGVEMISSEAGAVD